MGKFEVTQGQFQHILGMNPSNTRGDNNLPVENVGWKDIIRFVDTLGSRSGKQYRLPTEAEWEYAARGGGKRVKYGTGSDSITRSDACYGNDGINAGPVKVGSYKPNPLGLHDMSGNVWEYAFDQYSSNFYYSSPKNNPQKGVGNPSYPDNEYVENVIRGGAFNSPAENVRATRRDKINTQIWGRDQYSKRPNLGFRLVFTDK